jgi:hypothetical protein
MYFANPWGLLGLLSLPVIAVIHLYHRRFPPLLVAGMHLWGVETEVRAAGRQRERLPITATLLLELLTALVLSLVLSQPRWGDLAKTTHLVVVLDHSASMTATPPGEPSFRDAVVAELEERVAKLQRRSVVTLILSGRRPVMLAGPAVQWPQAKSRLEHWQPRATKHEFQPAWDLAAQLVEESGRLLFLTDHLPPQNVSTPKQMEIVSVGRRVENVAIGDARWTFDSTAAKGHIFLRIHNLGTRTADVTVSGRTQTGTTPIFRKSLSIPAGSAVPLQTEIPGGLGRLTIHVQSAEDGLAIDNTITLIEPKVRMLRLAVTLPENHSAVRSVRRVLAEIPDIQLGDSESADLIIGPSIPLPESRSDLWWLGIGPIDRSPQARNKAKVPSRNFPFLLEKRNPLLEGVVLGGVVWAGVQPLDLDVTPLISAGRHPLLARLNGTRTTAYVLNIDLARSNLPESPDWPILIKNLIDHRRDNLPGLRRWNYRLNEDIRFRLYERDDDASANSPDDLMLRHAGKSRPLARSSIVEVPPLDDTGVYEIRDGERSLGEFAVNFHDTQESTLTGLRPGTRDPRIDNESAKIALDDPYSWLIMLGIVLVILAVFTNWKVLRTS